MTQNQPSKLPVPVEAQDFRFLASPAAPKHAVLEVDTAGNPVRLFLTKKQLEELAQRARVAASKISD